MLRIGLRATKTVIAAEQGSVYCEVSLAPPAPADVREPETARNPISIVLCLDRSGSMGEPASRVPRRHERETKMSHARAAAVRMIKSLRVGDRFGLVSFSTLADVEVPLTEVDERVRDGLIAKVRSIEPDATTNVADGMTKSRDLFSEEVCRSHPCKIVLLSDGLANVGVSDVDGLASIARRIQSNGIAVSALGVGLDYSLEVMAGIAQAGGGEFYHLSDPAEIEAVVSGEVEDIKAVTVRQAVLRVKVPPMVALGTNLNLLDQQVTPDGVEIVIGDLPRPRQIVFEVATPEAAGLSVLPIQVTCIYLDARTGNEERVEACLQLHVVPHHIFLQAETDRELAGDAAVLLRAGAVRAAATAYEKGDLTTALDAFDRAAAILLSPEHAAPSAPALAQELEELRQRMADGVLDSDEARTQYSMSYAVSTSRSEVVQGAPPTGLGKRARAGRTGSKGGRQS